MIQATRFFIDGRWTEPDEARVISVIDPAREEATGSVALGSASDVDRAVAAARTAFRGFARTSRAERLDLLRSIVAAYAKRHAEIAATMTREIGCPREYAHKVQAALGTAHFNEAIAALTTFEFEQPRGKSLITKEPIGVCGLISAWNFPINLIACKVAPALAAGCTMVVKPSELAPLSPTIFAEVLDDAGVPPGVFNLVHGDGPTVGHAIAAHADVDMVSFTGSVRGGVAVAKAAADTVKRVTQELGGKSANILMPDVDFPAEVERGLLACFRNSGQSCSAPTRMLVPRERLREVASLAKQGAEALKVGDPNDADTTLGPVANRNQYDKVRGMIRMALEEGAELVTGSTERPTGLTRGYFVRPTVLVCEPGLTVAREEVFGPVLVLIGYESEEQAVEIANGTRYGLAAYVQSRDVERGRRIAAQMRAGTVHLNWPARDLSLPFGGYKQSGNGREYGQAGIDEYLETKSLVGFRAGS